MPREKSQPTDEVVTEKSQPTDEVTNVTVASVVREGKVVRVYTLEADGPEFKANAETFVNTRDDSYSVVLS